MGKRTQFCIGCNFIIIQNIPVNFQNILVVRRITLLSMANHATKYIKIASQGPMRQHSAQPTTTPISPTSNRQRLNFSYRRFLATRRFQRRGSDFQHTSMEESSCGPMVRLPTSQHGEAETKRWTVSGWRKRTRDMNGMIEAVGWAMHLFVNTKWVPTKV